MIAAELMRRRRAALRLVIFDCDGVLVDSEGVSNRVLAADLTTRGWPISAGEAEHLFLGTSIEAIERHAETAIGHKLPASWREQIKTAIVAAMTREAEAIPGAVAVLHHVTARGVPWRVASNSSHAEMKAKFSRIGIADLVAGRVHSYEDVEHGKPAPDLFLAAAAAEGVAPAECVVIEDSVPGATAAAAAGMDCLGYDRSSDGTYLAQAGAAPFHDMRDLPGLLDIALGHAA